MFATLDQPYLSLMFLSAGLLAYFAYELLYMVKSLLRLSVVGIAADFFAVLFAFIVYIFLSHAINYGRLQFYTAFSYLVGIFIMRVALKNTLRAVFMRFNDYLTRRIEAARERRRKVKTKLIDKKRAEVYNSVNDKPSRARKKKRAELQADNKQAGRKFAKSRGHKKNSRDFERKVRQD
jgi:ABC-type multidrug transport system fused ATPase/permease subunit